MKRFALILTAALWTIVMSAPRATAQAPAEPTPADTADIVATLGEGGKIVLDQPEGLDKRLKFKAGSAVSYTHLTLPTKA